LHAQMNLPDYALAVVNTTREPRARLTLTTRVVSLDGRILAKRQDRFDAPANQTTTLAPLDLTRALSKENLVFVRLVLTDARGRSVSDNFYWQGRDDASLKGLNALGIQPLRVTAHSTDIDGETAVRVTLENPGKTPALAAKLTLVDNAGQRILPAFYSDNYVSLLPGEAREIEIRCQGSPGAPARINLRGWNVEASSTAIGQTH